MRSTSSWRPMATYAAANSIDASMKNFFCLVRSLCAVLFFGAHSIEEITLRLFNLVLVERSKAVV